MHTLNVCVARICGNQTFPEMPEFPQLPRHKRIKKCQCSNSGKQQNIKNNHFKVLLI
jgi:hypothetical protein